LAAAIKKVKGYEVEIEPGARGAFEVYTDGVRVFSKLTLGRFPSSEDEVLTAM
jgi:selT/selW/selH-like putative selenoprotein